MKENTVRKVICIVRSRHFPSCPQSTVKQPKARSVIYRRTTDSPGDQRRMYRFSLGTGRLAAQRIWLYSVWIGNFIESGRLGFSYVR